ncbi:uncharacterized protein MYCFIDRAFT_169051 [Pseudocercospora fijiensis CIRAD86]|uniref:Stress-response A/B barrel domain-containing protein n=1 Tax=Pseudocercospora fijiensis (strain CIRAD86) TaxID=383855 RepID=N1Q8E1_PSEFD|nr:uncharacterized protein MYCFIDRAFT_169051 [Pseudocercospora fijiensis CIRAD86]EME87192.1 hypothetical protein MYCFIDRAFT_169051 [Pseudocercospora fijiensis CIRAD86]
MAQMHVKRTTMFKVPGEHIDTVLKEYEVLRKNAKRVSSPSMAFDVQCHIEPYIVSNVSRRVLNTGSPLSDGYTIVSQSIFKNHDDHEFYNKECEAHKELKARSSILGTDAAESSDMSLENHKQSPYWCVDPKVVKIITYSSSCISQLTKPPLRGREEFESIRNTSWPIVSTAARKEKLCGYVKNDISRMSRALYIVHCGIGCN